MRFFCPCRKTCSVDAYMLKLAMSSKFEAAGTNEKVQGMDFQKRIQLLKALFLQMHC
jgi:hypothetical protein